MEKLLTLDVWLDFYDSYYFDDKSVEMQQIAGWQFWFCKDHLLAAKTKYMGNIIKKLSKTTKINSKDVSVLFKNYISIDGTFYDSFGFLDNETRDILYSVRICNPDEESRYAVYGISNKFRKPLTGVSTVKDLIKWFNETN